jgi:hypothetical protein
MPPPMSSQPVRELQAPAQEPLPSSAPPVAACADALHACAEAFTAQMPLPYSDPRSWGRCTVLRQVPQAWASHLPLLRLCRLMMMRAPPLLRSQRRSARRLANMSSITTVVVAVVLPPLDALSPPFVPRASCCRLEPRPLLYRVSQGLASWAQP